MARLVIFGAGGFGREVLTAAREHPNVVIADDQFREGTIARSAIEPQDEIVIAIAHCEVRRRLAAEFERFGSLIAPTAVVGEEAHIGEGTIICDFAMVTHSARIGRHFHCNIYSYVAHDCVIGDFVTFAPRVSCNGNVHVGDGAFIGTGAVIRNGSSERPLTIGAGAFVCMGAVVTRDVPAGSRVRGNPAVVC